MARESIKPFVWGVVAGAVALLIVIFATGWVVTNRSAQATAEEMAETALVENLAPICVAQFLEDPNREERFKELKEKGSWQRGDFVKEAGWATMPRSKSPDPEVADECAKRIIELKR